MTDTSRAEDRDAAMAICDEKIVTWRERKRSRERAPEARASVRYEILNSAKGKCQLCGISSEVRPIDIDNIAPRSKVNKGGKVRYYGSNTTRIYRRVSAHLLTEEYLIKLFLACWFIGTVNYFFPPQDFASGADEFFGFSIAVEKRFLGEARNMFTAAKVAETYGPKENGLNWFQL